MLRRGRRRVVADDARRPTSSTTDQLREYVVTVNLGGFSHVDVRWLGASWEDVRDSFLEWLANDDAFADGLRFPHYRSLYVRFNGRPKLLTFRTDWVSGFTVH